MSSMRPPTLVIFLAMDACRQNVFEIWPRVWSQIRSHSHIDACWMSEINDRERVRSGSHNDVRS
jgi:hypothetical protein